MVGPADDFAHWLAAARAGSAEAIGSLFETYRRYLLLIAERELDAGLRAKGGASDLVQETFLDVQRDFARFQGTREEELLAWLRQLLLHNLGHFTRRYRATAKRQVARELPLDAGSSSADWAANLAADTSLPGERLLQNEQAQKVWQALDRLPEDYRQVLLLRYRDERPFEEIAQQMQRSTNAVRKLWARAIERLQHELGSFP